MKEATKRYSEVNSKTPSQREDNKNSQTSKNDQELKEMLLRLMSKIEM